MNFLWLLLATVVQALKFSVDADSKRCIRDFVGQESLVIVKTHTYGIQGDGQELSMNIIDARGSTLAYRQSLLGQAVFTFSPVPDTSFDICFENKRISTARHIPQRLYRDVDIEVEIGAAARDWSAVRAAERLAPAEVELRRISETAEEIKDSLEYLKAREERLRNTNESTNSRVKKFFFIIFLSFIALGVWQITYLRAYFRSKHII